MVSEGCEKASTTGVFLPVPLEVSAALQFCWHNCPFHSDLVLQLNTNPCRAVFKLDLCSNKYGLKNHVSWLYLEHPSRDVRIATRLGVGFFSPFFLVIVTVVFQGFGVIFFSCKSKITWNAKVADFVTCFHNSREKQIFEFPACQRSEVSAVQHVSCALKGSRSHFL